MATANGNFRWPTLCYFSPFCSHSSSGLPRNIFNLGSFVKTVPENISLKEKKRKARVVGFEMSWNLIFSIIKKKSFDKFFEKLISKSKHLCLEEWKLSRFSPKEVREKWALFFSVCVCDVIKVSRLPCRHAYYLWLVRGLNADFFIGNFTRNSSYLNDDFEKKVSFELLKFGELKFGSCFSFSIFLPEFSSARPRRLPKLATYALPVIKLYRATLNVQYSGV